MEGGDNGIQLHVTTQIVIYAIVELITQQITGIEIERDKNSKKIICTHVKFASVPHCELLVPSCANN